MGTAVDDRTMTRVTMNAMLERREFLMGVPLEYITNN
jgi:hypothetical protein